MYEINYALLLIIPETKEPEKAEADDDQSVRANKCFLERPETRTMPSQMRNMMMAEPRSGWSKTRKKKTKA